MDTQHRKHMSRDHHSPLRDVIADMEHTASSIVACVYRAVAWQRVDQIRYSVLIWTSET
jgi:hypothetical protein